MRRALEELERDGVLRRHQGLGTFLSGPKIMSDPSHTGGLGNTLGGSTDSSRVGTKVLEVSRCRPSEDLATALHIHPGEQVWRVHRQRSLGDKPLIVETAMIPVALAPDLDRAYSAGSLYETLATRYGLDDDYEEQVLDVIHATSDVRSLLRLQPARTRRADPRNHARHDGYAVRRVRAGLPSVGVRVLDRGEDQPSAAPRGHRAGLVGTPGRR